jgi:hypothetical protein
LIDDRRTTLAFVIGPGYVIDLTVEAAKKLEEKGIIEDRGGELVVKEPYGYNDVLYGWMDG